MKVPFVLLLLVDFLLTDARHILETEEGSNLTLSWTSPVPMDLSTLHMECRSRDEPWTMLMYMDGGVQKHQDEQFSGRVQCDIEALRQGQVQLFLTHLTTLDSGLYYCEIAANYDPNKGKWDFITTESFELKVTPKSPMFIIPHGDRRPAALKKKHDPGIAAGVIVGTLLVALSLMVGVMFVMRLVFTYH